MARIKRAVSGREGRRRNIIMNWLRGLPPPAPVIGERVRSLDIDELGVIEEQPLRQGIGIGLMGAHCPALITHRLMWIKPRGLSVLVGEDGPEVHLERGEVKRDLRVQNCLHEFWVVVLLSTMDRPWAMQRRGGRTGWIYSSVACEFFWGRRPAWGRSLSHIDGESTQGRLCERYAEGVRTS
jgi:hypothetical protein